VTTLSVNSSALAALLRDVRQGASKDSGLPMLAGVLLHTARAENGGTVLAATATDRYVLLHGHVADVTGDLPSQLWLTNSQVSQVMAMLRPYTTRRNAIGQRTEITVEDGKVGFAQAQLDSDLGSISLTFALNAGVFPDFPKLIAKARDAEPSPDLFAINGENLVKIARIAAQRGEFMRMRSSGRTQPVLVEIGREFIALAMPVRLGDREALDIPVYPVPVLDEAVAA
jgi:hypothetical protein